MAVSKIKSAGRVGVQAVPLTAGFDSDLRAELKKIEKLLKVKVDVVIDTDRMKATLDAFQEKYKIKLGAVLDGGIGRELDQEIKKTQRNTEGFKIPAEFDLRIGDQIKRLEQELQRRTRDIELSLPATKEGQSKRDKLSSESDKIRQKMYFTPALTPESREKLIKESEKLIKKIKPQEYGVDLVTNKITSAERKRAQNDLDKAFADTMVRLDFSADDNKVREALLKQRKSLEQSVAGNLQLPVTSANFKTARKQIDEFIKELEKTAIKVPLSLNETDANTVARMKKEIQQRIGVLEAEIKPTLSGAATRARLQEEARRAVEAVESLEANMILGLADEQARHEAESLIHEINGRKIGLQVEANVLAANARLREFMTRPRTATIHVDANTKKAAAEIKALIASMSGLSTANRQFDNLNKMLTNASTIIPRVGAMSSVIGGIGSAAIASVAGMASLIKSAESLLGVLGLIPAAGAGLAVMGGTLITAFNGVLKATAALAADRSGGGGVVRNSKVQAIQVAQAQRRIATAHENAADAAVRADERIIETQQAVADAVLEQGQDRIRSQKAVTDAQRSYDEAVRDTGKMESKLTDARIKAIKVIDDLARAEKNATLSRREAEIEYQKAVQAFESAEGDTSRSASAKAELELAMDSAKQKRDDAIDDEKQLGKESKKAASAGVSGNEAYQAAQEAIAANQERILRATESLSYAQSEQATNAVKYAGRVRNARLDQVRAEKSAEDAARTSQRAIIEAEEAAYMLSVQRTDTASRAEDAMAQLTAEGQRAARAFLQVREMLSGVRAIVQDNFFRGFTTPMLNMVTTLLPQLERGMGNVSTQMGKGWGQFFDSLSSSLGGGVLEKILNNIATAIENGNKAIDPLVRAFTDLTEVGSEFLPQLADGFAKWASEWANFISEAKADGSLKQWMQDGIDGFKQLGSILKGVYGIFSAVARAATAAGGMTMGSLGEELNKAATLMSEPKFQEAMTHVFKGAGLAMDGIAVGVKALGQVFANNGPQIEKIMGSLGTNLGKIGEIFAKILGDPKVMAGIQTLLDGFGKGLDKVLEAAPQISSFIGDMLEIGGKVGELWGTMIAETYKFLAPILEFLKPIIKFLIDLAIFAAPVLAWFIPIGKVFMGLRIGATLLTKAGGFLVKFFDDLGKGAGGASKFLDDLGLAVGKVFPNVGKWISELGPSMSKWFDETLAGAGTWLTNSGKAILDGFIKGFTSMWPKLKEGVSGVLGNLRKFFPFSPAQVGPFSGSGYTTHSGAALAGGFAEGIRSGEGNLRNAVSRLMSGTKVGFDGAMRNLESFSREVLNRLGFNGDELVNSGKALMRGLGEGIKSVSPGLYKQVEGVMGQVRKYFPFSPAKLGPFAGSGYTTYSGRALASDFAKGIVDSTRDVTKASLGLVSAVELPTAAKFDYGSFAEITSREGGASFGTTNITNNAYEVISAESTALELTRKQRAKRA